MISPTTSKYSARNIWELVVFTVCWICLALNTHGLFQGAPPASRYFELHTSLDGSTVFACSEDLSGVCASSQRVMIRLSDGNCEIVPEAEFRRRTQKPATDGVIRWMSHDAWSCFGGQTLNELKPDRTFVRSSGYPDSAFLVGDFLVSRSSTQDPLAHLRRIQKNAIYWRSMIDPNAVEFEKSLPTSMKNVRIEPILHSTDRFLLQAIDATDMPQVSLLRMVDGQRIERIQQWAGHIGGPEIAHVFCIDRGNLTSREFFNAESGGLIGNLPRTMPLQGAEAVSFTHSESISAGQGSALYWKRLGDRFVAKVIEFGGNKLVEYPEIQLAKHSWPMLSDALPNCLISMSVTYECQVIDYKTGVCRAQIQPYRFRSLRVFFTTLSWSIGIVWWIRLANKLNLQLFAMYSVLLSSVLGWIWLSRQEQSWDLFIQQSCLAGSIVVSGCLVIGSSRIASKLLQCGSVICLCLIVLSPQGSYQCWRVVAHCAFSTCILFLILVITWMWHFLIERGVHHSLSIQWMGFRPTNCVSQRPNWSISILEWSVLVVLTSVIVDRCVKLPYSGTEMFFHQLAEQFPNFLEETGLYTSILIATLIPNRFLFASSSLLFYFGLTYLFMLSAFCPGFQGSHTLIQTAIRHLPTQNVTVMVLVYVLALPLRLRNN